MKVKVEGATIEISEEMCKTNKSIIDALLPYYPAVANADIKREGKGDATVITVTKKAGTKGTYGPVIAALDAAPETISQLLIIDAINPRLKRTVDLDDALDQFIGEEQEVLRVVKLLDEAEPQSAAIPPVGF